MSAQPSSAAPIWLPQDFARVGLSPQHKGPDGVAAFVPVRHGAHAGRREWSVLDERERYLARLRATASKLTVEPVLSHYSAAAVWGLAILGRWPEVLHQVVIGDANRSTSHVMRHRRREIGEVVRREGFWTTCPVPTVLDLAGHTSFASALIAADQALAFGLLSADELTAALADRTGRRGVRTMRAVVAAADAGSESVGESLSRARMLQARLPVPVLQQEFADGQGFIGRCDFYWPEHRVVGEFDGRLKYGREFDAQGSAEERVWREKLREDRLRDLGLRVVRWVWDDALRGEPLVRVLGRHGIRPER